jgi:hypothetical protein
MNREEVVAVMSELLGRQIETGEPAFEEWAEAARIPAGKEQWQGMKDVFAYYAHYPLGGNSLALRAILR